MTTDLLPRTEHNSDTVQPFLEQLATVKVARALEEERLRISRDLHDQTAQQIAMLKFSLADMKNDVSGETGSRKLAQAICDIERLAKDLHAIVHGFRMSAVERFGLVPALDAMIADWVRRFGIAADFRAIGTEDLRDPAVENTLFSIVQESMTNVAKHALTAKAVTVTLRCTKSEILLNITDDGGGLVQVGTVGEAPTQTRTFGLLGMRERLALIGGELQVSSGKSGTSVTARILSRSL